MELRTLIANLLQPQFVGPNAKNLHERYKVPGGGETRDTFMVLVGGGRILFIRQERVKTLLKFKVIENLLLGTKVYDISSFIITVARL